MLISEIYSFISSFKCDIITFKCYHHNYNQYAQYTHNSIVYITDFSAIISTANEILVNNTNDVTDDNG